MKRKTDTRRNKESRRGREEGREREEEGKRGRWKGEGEAGRGEEGKRGREEERKREEQRGEREREESQEQESDVSPFFLQESNVSPLSRNSVQALAFACLARVAIMLRSQWEPCLKLLADTHQLDNASLVGKFPDWLSNCSVCALECAWNILKENSDCQKLLNACNGFCARRDISKQPPELQKSIYKTYLYVHHSFGLRGFRFRKLKRWFQAAELRTYIGRALRLCDNIRSHVPPCVLHAL